eukprot:4933337-Prorocentrum_lima.AAC.1
MGRPLDREETDLAQQLAHALARWQVQALKGPGPTHRGRQGTTRRIDIIAGPPADAHSTAIMHKWATVSDQT